jgi:hypothetical protein
VCSAGIPRPTSAFLTAAVRGIAPVPSSSTGRRAARTASASIARPARAAAFAAARSGWASTPFSTRGGPCWSAAPSAMFTMTGPAGAASAMPTALAATAAAAAGGPPTVNAALATDRPSASWSIRW